MKSYTITFDPTLDWLGVDAVIESLRSVGAETLSVQRFIGTAIVTTDEQQLALIQNVSGVIGATEVGKTSAAEVSPRVTWHEGVAPPSYELGLPDEIHFWKSAHDGYIYILRKIFREGGDMPVWCRWNLGVAIKDVGVLSG